MKRFFLVLICLILALACISCAQSKNDPSGDGVNPAGLEDPAAILPETFVFPEGAHAAGMDISGMSLSEAYNSICKKTDAYILSVRINDATLFFSAADLELSCDKTELAKYAVALYSGNSTSDIHPVLYNKETVQGYIYNAVNTPAENAFIAYNRETNLFEAFPGTDGSLIDMEAVTTQLDHALQHLLQEVTVTAGTSPSTPQINLTDSRVNAAVLKANKYLSTEISYVFNTEEELEDVTLTPERIASMVRFKYDLTPYIDPDALRAYVDELDTQYGMTPIEGNFITTTGTTTDLTVKYYAPYVDVEALYNELMENLEKGVSYTRFAPQISDPVPQEMPFKGSYIEVDLTNQKLYLYKDTQCIMETPIVTGCISRYMRTPTGVYSVLTRRMHVILKGEDYETYVKYWMQFKGGYGLHDAYWRWQFGGNEYLYNGSHGCVNIPPDNAAFLFENIYVGYPVVLHGGASNDGPLQQSIVGTETYDLSIHTKPFQLDAKPAAGTGKLTYTSSNPSVASVTEDGTVTVYKTGSTVISVDFAESRYYTAASMKIKIKVDDPCGDDHTFGPWEITTEPSCEAGIQTRKCTACDIEESKLAAATCAHTYGDWQIAVEPECKEGIKRKTCDICGHTLNYTLPAAHDLRDWKVRKEPACEEPGEHYRSCRDCDYEETEELPALEHCFTSDKEFCENCDAPNPNWVAPTEETDE